MKYLVFFLCLPAILGKNIFPVKKTTPSHTLRILNGEAAKDGEFPWHALLLSKEPNQQILRVCNGAIISEEWVLTTASCIATSENVYVGVGSVVVANFSLFYWDRGFVHEEYNASTLYNDIGLVHMANPLPFDENIKAVALATEDVEAGVEATATGWGFYSGSEEDIYYIADSLKYAKVKTLDNSECQQVYGIDAIAPSMVCTNGDSGSPCVGDSGAPLVVNAYTDPVLVGVFSFYGGTSCEANPAGFTRTASYLEWIRTTTQLPYGF